MGSEKWLTWFSLLRGSFAPELSAGETNTDIDTSADADNANVVSSKTTEAPSPMPSRSMSYDTEASAILQSKILEPNKPVHDKEEAPVPEKEHQEEAPLAELELLHSKEGIKFLHPVKITAENASKDIPGSETTANPVDLLVWKTSPTILLSSFVR